jgi:hypothetical protein
MVQKSNNLRLPGASEKQEGSRETLWQLQLDGSWWKGDKTEKSEGSGFKSEVLVKPLQLLKLLCPCLGQWPVLKALRDPEPCLQSILHCLPPLRSHPRVLHSSR